ncbi:PREDICTED: uncharacterized protein LOC104699120 [Camelina sativa]|uniref:Uncharacterized protein LOC104699120 n=1 Tax=Camelina sativa TaxID=90675 RepID=A0ABM0SL30_CAMSA|nr:PREDICTED: uncharacterized protein LOC104699120 [Camelina sativa]
MSYVPPHKRHENVAVRASPVPTKPNKTLGNSDRTIIYADDWISRLLLVSSNGDDSFQLVPVSSEWRRDTEEKSLVILTKSDYIKPENPWLWVAAKVEDDLILGFGRAKKMLLRYGSEDVKVNLRLIARFGKVLDGPLVEVRTLNKLKKSFQTNVPKSYVVNIEYGGVPDMGFCVEKTKELYLVKVLDNTRPDVTIDCRCKVDNQHKRLNMYKHLILDVSCLDQDLDLRLMVDSKRTLTNLSENEIKNLKELTDSAVIDPNVKGGLKWPLGKSSSADRYNVCGVWHTVTTTYGNRTMKLRTTKADRYDFRTGVGGTTREVDLKLKAVSSILLKEENVERKCVSDMLKDCLKTVWDYFLKAV